MMQNYVNYQFLTNIFTLFPISAPVKTILFPNFAPIKTTLFPKFMFWNFTECCDTSLLGSAICWLPNCSPKSIVPQSPIHPKHPKHLKNPKFPNLPKNLKLPNLLFIKQQRLQTAFFHCLQPSRIMDFVCNRRTYLHNILELIYQLLANIFWPKNRREMQILTFRQLNWRFDKKNKVKSQETMVWPVWIVGQVWLIESDITSD